MRGAQKAFSLLHLNKRKLRFLLKFEQPDLLKFPQNLLAILEFLELVGDFYKTQNL